MSWSGQSWGPEQPRFVADFTGDSSADIVGFGLDGVWVSLNNGNGTFQPPNMALSAFSFHTGWRVESHPRLLADLTGDGAFQPAKFVVADLGYDQVRSVRSFLTTWSAKLPRCAWTCKAPA